MKNRTVVLFEKGQNPRIYKNPPSLSELQGRGDILVNPSIPKGIAPHRWKLVNGKIKVKGGMKIDEAFPESRTFTPKSWTYPALLFIVAVDFGITIYDKREVLKAFFADLF